MAFQAGGHSWQSGEGLGFKERVTGVTLQPLFHMFLVIKGNRLPGFEALAEGDEEKEQNNSDRNSDEEEFHLVSSLNRLYLVLKDNNRRHKKITRKAADILFALRIPWGFGLPPE
jgi:hypothetical protein